MTVAPIDALLQGACPYIDTATRNYVAASLNLALRQHVMYDVELNTFSNQRRWVKQCTVGILVYSMDDVHQLRDIVGDVHTVSFYDSCCGPDVYEAVAQLFPRVPSLKDINLTEHTVKHIAQMSHITTLGILRWNVLEPHIPHVFERLQSVSLAADIGIALDDAIQQIAVLCPNIIHFNIPFDDEHVIHTEYGCAALLDIARRIRTVEGMLCICNVIESSSWYQDSPFTSDSARKVITDIIVHDAAFPDEARIDFVSRLVGTQIRGCFLSIEVRDMLLRCLHGYSSLDVLNDTWRVLSSTLDAGYNDSADVTDSSCRFRRELELAKSLFATHEMCHQLIDAMTESEEGDVTGILRGILTTLLRHYPHSMFATIIVRDKLVDVINRALSVDVMRSRLRTLGYVLHACTGFRELVQTDDVRRALLLGVCRHHPQCVIQSYDALLQSIRCDCHSAVQRTAVRDALVTAICDALSEEDLLFLNDVLDVVLNYGCGMLSHFAAAGVVGRLMSVFCAATEPGVLSVRGATLRLLVCEWDDVTIDMMEQYQPMYDQFASKDVCEQFRDAMIRPSTVASPNAIDEFADVLDVLTRRCPGIEDHFNTREVAEWLKAACASENDKCDPCNLGAHDILGLLSHCSAVQFADIV